MNLTSCSGGGEPVQPGAACRGKGGQLSLHGLPYRDCEGHSGSRTLRDPAHHLSARGRWTLSLARLLPRPRPAKVKAVGDAGICGSSVELSC